MSSYLGISQEYPYSRHQWQPSSTANSQNSHSSYILHPNSATPTLDSGISQQELQSPRIPDSDSYSYSHEWQAPTRMPDSDSYSYSHEQWQAPTKVVLPVFSRMDVVNHSYGQSATTPLPNSNSNVKTKKPPQNKSVTKPSEPDPKPSKPQGPRFERQDYLNIIAYLSDPSKYNALFGAGKKTLVNGQSMNVLACWNLFSSHIQELYNQRHPTNALTLTGRKLQLRFLRYRQLYCAAKRFPKKTGSGTSPADRKLGIHTLEAKLESLCPCYSEMDELFGSKANVTAMREWDSLVLSDSDDDDDDENEDQLECTSSDDDSDIDFQSGQFAPPKHIIGRSREPAARSHSHTLADLLLEDGDDDNLPDVDGIFQPLSSTIDNLEPFRTLPSSSKLPSLEKEKGSNLGKGKGKQKQANSKKPKRKPNEIDDDGANDVAPGDPLPPISQPVVKPRDNKPSLAQAFADASASKMLMFEQASQWEQVHQAKKMKLENTRAVNELAWAKEKFGLELKDRVEERRINQMEKWLAEGKTVAQIEMLFRIATVPAGPSVTLTQP